MSDLAKKLHLRALARLSLKRASKINLADAALDREAAAALTLANARIARLEEALKFYSDPGDYTAPQTRYIHGGENKLYFDCGSRARAALKGDA